MRRDEPGAVQVEPSILKRQGGTYAVSVGANWVIHRKSFPTLAEARAFKREIIASRKKREYRRGEIDLAGDVTEERQEIRKQIKSAPKTKVNREGRDFTLVKLPDDPRLKMRRDLRDPQKLGELYLDVRSKGIAIETAILMPADNYENGQFISADPAEHHSKTPQRLGNLNDGGE